MTKTTTNPTPPRRRLLAGTPGALAVLAMIPVASLASQGAGDPDAELIRLCGEYHFHRSAFLNQPQLDDEQEYERRMDIEHAAYWEAVEAIQTMPASTLKGLAVKASVLRRAIPQSDDQYHDLALSLADDCIRLGGLQA